MTIEELRVFLGEWWCGCGAPDEAARRLRDILALHPLHSNRASFEKLIPDSGVEYLLLYTLDHFDLTEHGGTVGGGWLTEKGQAVLDALNREHATDFARLGVNACIHGHDVDESQCQACLSDIQRPAAPSADLPALRERLLKAIQPVGDCCPFCDVRYDAPEGKHGESCALHLLREAANVLHTIELGGAREQP